MRLSELMLRDRVAVPLGLFRRPLMNDAARMRSRPWIRPAACPARASSSRRGLPDSPSSGQPLAQRPGALLRGLGAPRRERAVGRMDRPAAYQPRRAAAPSRGFLPWPGCRRRSSCLSLSRRRRHTLPGEARFGSFSWGETWYASGFLQLRDMGLHVGSVGLALLTDCNRLERPLHSEQRRQPIGEAAVGHGKSQVERDQHPLRDVALDPEAAAEVQYDSVVKKMSSSVTLPAAPVRSTWSTWRGESTTRWPNTRR